MFKLLHGPLKSKNKGFSCINLSTWGWSFFGVSWSLQKYFFMEAKCMSYIGGGPKISITKSSQHWPQHVRYCWWFRNPAITTWDCAKTLQIMEKNYQPPLVTTRFLNHQQYPQLPIFNAFQHTMEGNPHPTVPPFKGSVFCLSEKLLRWCFNKHPGWLTSRNVVRMVGEWGLWVVVQLLEMQIIYHHNIIFERLLNQLHFSSCNIGAGDLLKTKHPLSHQSILRNAKCLCNNNNCRINPSAEKNWLLQMSKVNLSDAGGHSGFFSNHILSLC